MKRLVVRVIGMGVLIASAFAETYTTNVVSGISTNMGGDYTIGLTGPFNYFEINNAGMVTNATGTIGKISAAYSNSVVVTGQNSVWYNTGGLFVGGSGEPYGNSSYGNQMVIAGGGRVRSAYGGVGYLNSMSNVVLITGNGSVWECTGSLGFGVSGAVNRVTIEAGGRLQCTEGEVGGGYGSSNLVVVTGALSRWDVARTLNVGWSGISNRLVIADGGVVISSNAVISQFPSVPNNVLEVVNGMLVVTNSLENGNLDVRCGVLKCVGGSITTDQLLATNGTSSIITFTSGFLQSRGTAVSNAVVFEVGDGTNPATFHLQNGIHTFNDALHINTNATLTGCGTIYGVVINDGTIMSDCSGGTLTFNGPVTNNAVIKAVNGSVLEAFGSFVNNGTIYILYGTTNFHGAFINHGVVLDAAGDADGDGYTNLQEDSAGTDPLNAGSFPRVADIMVVDGAVVVKVAAVTGRIYQLQAKWSLLAGDWDNVGGAVTGTDGVLTLTDPGGAAQGQRVYRVKITKP